jgi:hypothetical protein
MIERKPHTAFWKCLHTQGHDAALLTPGLIGWHLTGMASFRNRRGPVAANYTVELDEAWLTRRGSVRGFASGKRFHHSFERKPEGWLLDGKPCGLSHITDLDFGFTPATNLPQLQRAALQIGDRAEFPVAWFDIGKDSLTELPQIYERRDENLYWYESPTSEYAETLEVDSSGFIRLYPMLWEMEGQRAARPLAQPRNAEPNSASASSAVQ